MTPPTTLDPRARAVGLEVALASYGLIEDLVLRARGVSRLGVREQGVRSPFPSYIGSTIFDIVASQSRFSLPTVSGLTETDARADTVWPGGNEE